MGALTSKCTQFNYRPWENKAIDSADSSDSSRVPIQPNIRSNNIMRVLPRLSIGSQSSWISDRTRFFIDGLERQRIQTPLWRKHYKYTNNYSMSTIANNKTTNVFTISWNLAFSLTKRYYTTSSTAILSSTVDYPSTTLVSNVFNNVVLDNNGSHIPTVYHLTPSGAIDPLPTKAPVERRPFSEYAASLLLGLEVELRPVRPRRVAYITVNLSIRKFPSLNLYLQQLASEPGAYQNYFYSFGNNFSMWNPFTDYLGYVTALPDYLAGKMKGVLQMQQFETIVFINGRWGDASDFLSADDLAKLLPDNNWGLKHNKIYVFDLPNNPRDYISYYLNIRNSFYPRWQPDQVGFHDLLFMFDDPNIAVRAQQDAMDQVQDTLDLDTDEREMGIFVKHKYPNWRDAPGISRAYVESTQTRDPGITYRSHGARSLGSVPSFTISYGSHRSKTSSRSDPNLPARTPFERTTTFAIDCSGRVAKFALRYPGPIHPKDSIDMFTELAEFIQKPLALNIPNPLLYVRTTSNIPFYVETKTSTFSSISDIYIYDDYRIDAITKASPMMALCSERFTHKEINFNLTLSN